MRAVNYANRLKPPSRAHRLAKEARNCLTIAVGQRDPDFAAELIDEAARLAARARQLSA